MLTCRLHLGAKPLPLAFLVQTKYKICPCRKSGREGNAISRIKKRRGDLKWIILPAVCGQDRTGMARISREKKKHRLGKDHLLYIMPFLVGIIQFAKFAYETMCTFTLHPHMERAKVDCPMPAIGTDTGGYLPIFVPWLSRPQQLPLSVFDSEFSRR
jgi:hypothetical protein